MENHPIMKGHHHAHPIPRPLPLPFSTNTHKSTNVLESRIIVTGAFVLFQHFVDLNPKMGGCIPILLLYFTLLRHHEVLNI